MQGYCLECRKQRNYTIKNESFSGTYQGKEFSYTGQVAECNNCNTKIYVRDIENENTKSRYRKVIEINESNEK